MAVSDGFAESGFNAAACAPGTRWLTYEKREGKKSKFKAQRGMLRLLGRSTVRANDSIRKNSFTVILSDPHLAGAQMQRVAQLSAWRFRAAGR